jgi:xanthine dehydrogenase molybdenum-binding subunit
MKFPNLLYAKILFSQIPHGIVKSIDTSKAEALDGVVKVFTHLNTTKKCYDSYITNAGEKTVEDERLFADKVRFVGERVAAVVAVNKHIAKKAVSLIEVEYEELTALSTMLEALSSDTKFRENGNLLSEGNLSIGDAKDKIDKAGYEYNVHVHTQKVHHGAMEKHANLTLGNARLKDVLLEGAKVFDFEK